MTMSMARRVLLSLGVIAVILGLAVWAVLRWQAGAAEDPAFYEAAIVAFERSDREAPPAPGAIVFVGSSSIRFWSTLGRDMDPLPVLNRGFGGAHLSHVIHNAARIVLPYAPRAIVLYAGENDLGSGKDVETVVSEYRTLVRIVRESLPETPIYFLSIKPTKLRWSVWPQTTLANERIEAISERDPTLHYLDVTAVLLGEDGEPRDDVFLLDGLHLNAAGYAAWTKVVAPALRAAFEETPG